MPLIDRSVFAPLFKPLAGQRTGFIQLPGNHGDSLIRQAALQMFDDFGCDYIELDPLKIERGQEPEGIDLIVIGGGGSLGTTYARNHALRQRLLGLGRDVVIFPQSIVDPNEDLAAYRQVYVREASSQGLADGLVLFPDLALGLEWEMDTRTRPGSGVFLRRDVEQGLPPDDRSLGDPVDLVETMEEYITLAGSFEHILTDRLHFALAAMMHGVDVTLLPGSYFKNRAMYETWLADLGCRWQDALPG